MEKDLFCRMISAIDEIGCAAYEVEDVGFLVRSLDKQLEEEVEQLNEEPRMVMIFLERYPMYSAIIRTIRNSLDRQVKAINAECEAATSLLREIKADAKEPAAFHAGYEAGKKAAAQAEPQG